MNQIVIPKWQKELASFLGIKSGIILEGRVYDEYPVFMDYDMAKTEVSPEDLDDFSNLDLALNAICRGGAKYVYHENGEESGTDVIFYDPLMGFYCYEDSEEGQRALIEPYMEGYRYENEILGSAMRLCFRISGKNGDRERHAADAREIWMSEIVRNGLKREPDERERNTVFIVKFSSRMHKHSSDEYDRDIEEIFFNLSEGVYGARSIHGRCNTVILVVDKFSDVPNWFFSDNPATRTITLTVPDRATRRLFFGNNNGAMLRPYQCLGDEDFAPGKDLVAETEGLQCKELRQILQLAFKGQIAPEEIDTAFQLYKFGVKENPWDQLGSDIITDTRAILTSRVLGQDEALEKVIGVIMRAVKGLSGLQHSNASSKPRGILFFAGPTGVGKTEMAKSIAEALFGDDHACIRFDMSEYREESSDQKLFGAPPGYVGYGHGGQLTNAVKTRPFSVLLFDEIEKASPTVLDKFLQILEDGRLTDGQGETVYFGETIIVFTSNIGLTKEVVDPVTGHRSKELTIRIPDPAKEDTDAFRDTVSDTLTKGVEQYFTDIGRPELLNRIGKDNVVVFQFIGMQAAKNICASKMKQICARLKETKDIDVDYSEVLPALQEKAVMERENGGRGVGNMLEREFLNPIARYICETPDGLKTLRCSLSPEGKIVFSE